MQEILKEGRLYEVGGFVRDTLLHHRPDSKDRDYLVCGITYDRLVELLRRHGFVDLVGKSFGVIKFTPRGQQVDSPVTFDISLPRKEISTGLAHRDFEVDFDPNLPVEQDLLRRDFSMNAMARDMASNQLVDPYGGLKDLQNKTIRMVSENSFREDPLRMLRAVQFAARFEFEIEPETLKALKENVALIATVSPERIAEELAKMLTRAEKPSIGFRLMRDMGLLSFILPELGKTIGCEQPGGYHKYDVFEHTMHIVDAAAPRLRLRLAALFHDITKPDHKRPTDTGASFYGHESSGARVAGKVLKRLRFSNELIREVSLLVDRHMFTTDVGPKGLRRFIRRVGQNLIPDLLDLRRADVIAQSMGGNTDDVDEMQQAIHDEIERKPPFGPSDLALNGRDLMKEFDLPSSPLIGEVIEHLMEKVLDVPEDNDREILLRYASEFLKNKNKLT